MDAVMAGITDAQRSVGAKGPLQFQAPPLVLRRVRPRVRNSDGRRRKPGRREVGNRGLNLGKSFTGGKAFDECVIGSGSILREAGALIGRKVVSGNGVGVQERGIACKNPREVAQHRVIKDADSTSNYRVM